MGDDARTKVRRKKYFLFNSSQPELYGKILLFFLIILLVSSSIFYLLSNKELEMEWYRAHSTMKHVAEMFFPWLIITDIAGIAVVAVLLIFFTHRIAGANFRIRKDLEAIRKGNLSKRIKLRRGDELQDIAHCLNMTFEEMKGKIEKAVGSMLDTELKANAVIHYMGDGNNKELAREEAAQLVITIRRIKEELQSFIA